MLLWNFGLVALGLIIVLAPLPAIGQTRTSLLFEGPIYSCLSFEQRKFAAGTMTVRASEGRLEDSSSEGTGGLSFYVTERCASGRSVTLIFPRPVKNVKLRVITMLEPISVNSGPPIMLPYGTPWGDTNLEIPGPIGILSIRGTAKTLPGSSWYLGIDNVSFEEATTTNLEVGFDLSVASYPDGVKMLVAKHRTDDTFPQGEQKEPDSQGRPQMLVKGSVRDKATGAAPTSPTPIYLRLRDPEDTAAYVPSKSAVAGDNVDRVATLSKGDGSNPVGLWDCPQGSGVTCPTRGELRIDLLANQGDFEVLLAGSKNVAGDNYQVEASLQPGVTCQPPSDKCATTATITMWKRAYVQERSSFVRGGRVAVDYIADTEEPSDVVYVRPAKGTKLNEGQIVQFVHAKKLDGSDSCEYYTDERKVLAAVKAGDGPVALKLNLPLDRYYYASDASRYSLADARGADGFGIPDEGVQATADLGGAVSLLSEAFVELVELAGNDAPTMYPTTHLTNADIEVLSAKWFPQQTKGNHFLVVSAGSSIEEDSIPLGVVHPTVRNVIWAFTGRIHSYTLLPSNARAALAREVVAHEMSHGWRVNPDLSVASAFDTDGHCKHHEEDVSEERFVCRHWRFDNERESCIMNETFFIKFHDRNVVPDNLPAPEYYDGEEKFHYIQGVIPSPSEYVRIRSAHEPVTAY